MSWKPEPGTPLTASEIVVLNAIAAGYTDRQIARHNSLSAHTVGLYVRNAMRRLGGHSRTHAVVLAHQRGELPLRCGWTEEAS